MSVYIDRERAGFPVQSVGCPVDLSVDDDVRAEGVASEFESFV